MSLSTWLSGARPRTLTLSAVPVVLGTAAAQHAGGANIGLAVLALLTALFLQVGVNYSNDYSDGVRGTDQFRVGPPRLTGSGAARPRMVLAVALAFFLLGAASGLVLILLTQEWWLAAVGVAAIAAAWSYTGGSRPYGYAGLGEVAVFVFFGLVATVGTEYVQTKAFSVLGLISAAAAGFFACAVLMVNNIRDIEPDRRAGKRTLAVKLGLRSARIAYGALLAAPYVLAVVIVVTHPFAILGVVSLPLTVRAFVLGTRSSKPLELITALKSTSFGALLFAIALGLGLVLT
ncbi:MULTISPECIES: 1,4-dihydroxy-2-naphthoate polyprenyltransferase [unclassified Microbacterium]|uniref:1,4-dihydroxy-2-naphthoate polyprenyltransferase n=1 Tax=unclassified Microbacterium TaxID=2609290 RepID=UPI0037461BDA